MEFEDSSITLFVIILLLLSSEGTEGIYGGEDAPAGSYTYHVSVIKSGRVICGGAILNERHIITAAHCVAYKNGSFINKPLKVVGGTNDLNTELTRKTVVDVERAYIHKEYTQYKTYRTADIAVLKLKTPFNFSSNVNLSAIELPDGNEIFIGKTATVTGFGWNTVNTYRHPITGVVRETGVSSGKLRFAETKIISEDDCQRNEYYPISKSLICARVIQRKATEIRGVCGDDSGGPLVYDGKILVGILNFSPIGCIEDKTPGIYAKISSHVKFIQKALTGKFNVDILSSALLIDMYSKQIFT